MKRILLILILILMGFRTETFAQDYTSYLTKAYEEYAKGNIDVAKSSYSVYKKLTKKTDIDFETLLADAEKANNVLGNDCYFIALNDSITLAVQKFDPNQKLLTYDDAVKRCASNRLGGFSEWRLPYEHELSIIFANTQMTDMNENVFWYKAYESNSTSGYVFYTSYSNRWNYIKSQNAMKVSGETIEISYWYWRSDSGKKDHKIEINGKYHSKGERFVANYLVVRTVKK